MTLGRAGSAALSLLVVVGVGPWRPTADRAPGPEERAAVTASPSSAAELTDVVCPTLSTCEATGTNKAGTLGILFRTSDGGRQWLRQVLPTGVDQVHAVACPSATTCEAVGVAKSSSAALQTTNGGHNWTVRQLPAGAGAIACPTVSVCEAVGDNGALRTTDGGTSWVLQRVPAVAYQLVSIACPRVTTCEAVGWSAGFNPVGVIIGTEDGGATWRSEHLPTEQPPAAVSCPSLSTCEIALSPPLMGGPAKAQALRTTDGGSTWKLQNIVDGVVATSISCPTQNTCEAVGGTVFSYVAVRTTNGGSTWARQALSPPSSAKTLEAQAVACPSPVTCAAVGSLVKGNSSVGITARTTDGGKKWSITAP